MLDPEGNWFVFHIHVNTFMEIYMYEKHLQITVYVNTSDQLLELTCTLLCVKEAAHVYFYSVKRCLLELRHKSFYFMYLHPFMSNGFFHVATVKFVRMVHYVHVL